MPSRSAEPVAGSDQSYVFSRSKTALTPGGHAARVLLAALASADGDRVGLCWRIALSGALDRDRRLLDRMIRDIRLAECRE
jgi:hypothetical protein